MAQKLGIDVVELADEEVMNQIRQELDIGTLPLIADGATGIIAKSRIAELLEIKINSVDIFKSKLDLSGSSMGGDMFGEGPSDTIEKLDELLK